jgi:hypothetical protein
MKTIEDYEAMFPAANEAQPVEAFPTLAAIFENTPGYDIVERFGSAQGVGFFGYPELQDYMAVSVSGRIYPCSRRSGGDYAIGIDHTRRSIPA